MHEDDPADRAGETVEKDALAGSKLALPILGTPESIAKMSARTLRSFFRRNYRPQSLAVTASGNVDHAALVTLVRDATQSLDWPWGVAPQPLQRSMTPKRRKPAGSVHRLSWSGEQCNVALAVPGLPRRHPDRRALDVLNAIVGGGMSSRLFQAVREERGLAYSVYSSHSAFSDDGVFSVAAGCQPERAPEVFDVITAELRRVRQEGVSHEEIERAKGHLSGTIALSGEDTSSRMVTLGRAEVATGELLGLDEALARVAAVTPAQVARVAAGLLDQPRHVCAVGAPKDSATRRAMAAAAKGAGQ